MSAASLLHSGRHSTLAFATTFSNCIWLPLSSPLLMTPGNATHQISRAPSPSSSSYSSPPMSSIVRASNAVRWCAASAGLHTRNSAFCTARSRARSIAVATSDVREASRAGVAAASVMEDRSALMRAVTDAVRASVPGAREAVAARWRIERVVERQWFRGSSELAFNDSHRR